MNQPTEINAMVQGAILGTAARLTAMMFLDLFVNIIPREREQMRETLNREPNLEDWDDLSQALGERALIPRCLQRAKDREKICRLVFGEENPASS